MSVLVTQNSLTAILCRSEVVRIKSLYLTFASENNNLYDSEILLQYNSVLIDCFEAACSILVPCSSVPVEKIEPLEGLTSFSKRHKASAITTEYK